jgi:predicted TIM-barrel fold metal-dependent hydrolase
MAHGADPWWAVAIRLMLKYPNLYLMTSAYAPRYLPPELIHFMNTRGRDKIIFASDHPVLSMERCIQEAQALDLREGVLDRYLYANASRVFFEGRS